MLGQVWVLPQTSSVQPLFQRHARGWQGLFTPEGSAAPSRGGSGAGRREATTAASVEGRQLGSCEEKALVDASHGVER